MGLFRDATAYLGPGYGEEEYDPYASLSALARQLQPNMGVHQPPAPAMTGGQQLVGDAAGKIGAGRPTMTEQAVDMLLDQAGVTQAGQGMQAVKSAMVGDWQGAGNNASLLAMALAPMLMGVKGVGRATRELPPVLARDDPLFGTARFEGAPYPQYAEQYPPVGPPNIREGSRGNIYPEKQLTPEAIAFGKERQKVMGDMAKTPWTPYFDPAERSYVDPSNYPPRNVDTSTLMPSKPATRVKYAIPIDAPQTAAALSHAYDKGLDLGDSQHWYAMAQLEKRYIDQLGPQAGRAAFLDEFASPMAATTSGQNPRSNFLMAHYLEYLRKAGEPIPEGNQLPYPIGGRYVANNLRDYQNMRAGGGYAGLGANQPKMHNFDRSFIGDLSAPVMDEQMAGGMLAHAPELADAARTTAYGMLEQPVRDLAAEKGVAPGNVQDVAWAGFKNEQGKPMISEINEAIERTHRLTGMPRDEIVRRGIIGKQIPIYGLLGAAGLGAAASDR